MNTEKLRHELLWWRYFYFTMGGVHLGLTIKDFVNGKMLWSSAIPSLIWFVLSIYYFFQTRKDLKRDIIKEEEDILKKL